MGAASAACDREAPTLGEKQVWERISELQNLVTNARGERKQLNALAACLGEKKAEVQRVMTRKRARRTRFASDARATAPRSAVVPTAGNSVRCAEYSVQGVRAGLSCDALWRLRLTFRAPPRGGWCALLFWRRTLRGCA